MKKTFLFVLSFVLLFCLSFNVSNANNHQNKSTLQLKIYPNPSYGELLQIRDATLPYVIRSTAGLLYWWIILTKQLRPNNLGTLCDQQIHLSLFDQTLNGDHYTYQASIGSSPYTSYEQEHKGEIEICPSGSSGDFIITARAKNVTFKAGDHIIIKPGFSALAGSNVHLYIAPCTECPDEDINPQYLR